MIAELTPKPAGRPAKPEQIAKLEAENQQLREELEGLKARSAMIERMMTMVGGIASGRTPIPRSRGKKTKSEDPEPVPLQPLVTAMREQDLPTKLCSEVLGVSISTVRRLATPRPGNARRRRPLDERRAGRVCEIVRATHGLAGASGLAKQTGLSRRQCAAIKRREVREMELERKARCASVRIAAPGIVRGFDAMHVTCVDAVAYLLVAADGAVPYRTSLVVVDSYDAQSVIRALVHDFETNGPPLVIRLDRIACQRTTEVYNVLRSYEVLPLHGPPRLARFYGQLERQNREHREWQNVLGQVTRRELAASVERMTTALNTQWARPTLNWCTAEQVWQRRTSVQVDRAQLRDDVERRTSSFATCTPDPLRAQRLAIESALAARGLLTINQGGWC
jgi:hypothetical protein